MENEANNIKSPPSPNSPKNVEEFYKIESQSGISDAQNYELNTIKVDFIKLVNTLNSNLNKEFFFKFGNFVRLGYQHIQIKDANLEGWLNRYNDIVFVNYSYFKFYVNINFKKNHILYFFGINFKNQQNNIYEHKFAILFRSYLFEELEYVVQLIGYQYINVPKDFYLKFREAFLLANKGKNARNLNLLYEFAPEFILKERTYKQLYDDLFSLVNYEGISWWFNETSSSIFRLLSSIENLKNLYTTFYDNSEEVMNLYHALKSEGKKSLAIFLTELSKEYSTNKAEENLSIMPFGNEYVVDSNLFSNKKKVIIKIFKRNFYKTGSIKHSGDKILECTVNPLELVVWHNVETGEKRVVCALFVKQLSDEKEWSQLVKTVTIGVTIISIIISGGAIAGGATGVILLFAVVDITVGTLELLMYNEEVQKFLSKTEEGKWFIDNWGYISLAISAGIITIGSAQRIIKHGPKVVSNLKDAGKLKYYEAAVELEKLIEKAKEAIKTTPINHVNIDEVIIVGTKSNNIVNLSENVLQILNKLNLKISYLGTNAKIFDKSGELIYYLNKNDIEKFITFINKSTYSKKLEILKTTKSLQNSIKKFKIEYATTKGITGVKLSKNKTSVDFKGSPYIHPKGEIKMKLTGSRKLDSKTAYEEMFDKMGIKNPKRRKELYKELDEKYTWHHLDDLNENLESTFQLVEKNVHKELSHLCSVRQIEHLLKIKYLK